MEMTATGSVPVHDPSALFLADRRVGRDRLGRRGGAWRARVRCASRCSRSSRRRGAPMPRRVAQAFDGGRLAMLVAVLQQRAGVGLGDQDVYASVAGGVRVAEPARRPRGRARRSRVHATTSPSPADTVVHRRDRARRRGPPGAAGAAPAGRGAAARVPQRDRARVDARRPGHDAAPGRRPRARRCGGHVGGRPPARGSLGTSVPIRPGGGPLAQGRSEVLYAALRLVAPGTPVAGRHRPHPAGEDGRAHRRRRRPRGAEHLLRRVPARRRVHAAAPVGAGQDGRRDHPRVRRHPGRPCQRPPRPRSRHPHERDRHAPPHRRARRPPDLGAGDHRLRGDGRRVGALPGQQADARSRSRACSPAPTRRCRSSAATRRASTA